MEGKLYIQHEKLGTIEIAGKEDCITSVSFVEKLGSELETPMVYECKKQLMEYFMGYRKNFNFKKLKFDLKGTEFQKKVWESLLKIPYGKTTSYKKQSDMLGDPKACRAVASANSKNPFSIIFPCHRVIGEDGKLKGYAGGVKKKEYLIKFEEQVVEKRTKKIKCLKYYQVT